MAIAESWLNDNINLNFDEYNLFRNDRGLINLDTLKDTKGGGVAFFVHTSLCCNTVARSRINKIGETEFLMVRVSDASTKASCLLACVYRPPRGKSFDIFFDVLARNRH